MEKTVLSVHYLLCYPVLQHPDRGTTDGEGGVVECFLLVGVTHMGSPAVDTARHS